MTGDEGPAGPAGAGAAGTGAAGRAAAGLGSAAVRALARAGRATHWYLRELTGETAYDRYLERHAGCGEPMSRREFERRRWEERATTPGSRCC